MSSRPIIKAGKGLYFSTPVAHALMAEVGVSTPIEAIEAKANDLLEFVGVVGPPVNLEILASFTDVLRIEENDMPESGRLVPTLDGHFIIQVRSGDNRGRRNFTIAHEIGHALMPGATELNQPKVDVQTGWYKKEDDEEEFLCDVAARTLLLPGPLFRRYCEQVTPSLQNLCDLASVFDASLEAVAFRLASLRLWPCIPVFWELRLKRSQEKVRAPALPGFEDIGEPEKEFRVKFNAGHGTPNFFPAEKHVHRDNPMVTGCLSCGAFTGMSALPTSTGEVNFYIEAMRVPYNRNDGARQDRILSLAFFKPKKSKSQSALSLDVID